MEPALKKPKLDNNDNAPANDSADNQSGAGIPFVHDNMDQSGRRKCFTEGLWQTDECKNSDGEYSRVPQPNETAWPGEGSFLEALAVIESECARNEAELKTALVTRVEKQEPGAFRLEYEQMLRNLADTIKSGKERWTGLRNENRGLTRCCICKCLNGMSEYTIQMECVEKSGIVQKSYSWPENLGHYIREHHVVPSRQFFQLIWSLEATLPKPADA